jgi:hypothetical protein
MKENEMSVTRLLPAWYVVMGMAVLAVNLITNYQDSDKRDWNRSVPAAA